MCRWIFLIWILFFSVNGFAQCGTHINTYPFTEDFEADNGDWQTGGTSSSWTWGTPSKAIITGAGGGNRSWITGGLTSNAYNNGEDSWLMSPCFNFTSLSNPQISFKVFWETERNYDGTILEYSLNGGSNWTILGSENSNANCQGENWHNNPSIRYLGFTSGWAGTIKPTSGSCTGGGGIGSWVTAKHTLSMLAGEPSVRFRFRFGAGTTCNQYDGFAFDDFKIQEVQANPSGFTLECVGDNQVRVTTTARVCQTGLTWDFGDGTPVVSDIEDYVHTYSAPGNYTVILTTAFSNAPGSSSTKEVVILEATPVVVTPVACHGGNGSLSVQINGMPTGLSYTWTGYAAQTVPQIQVPAGNYDVRIEATNACSVTRSIVLTQPDALSVTGTTTPASCTAANGSVQTQIAGGTAPYTYSWSDGSTNANLSDVTAGSYTLTVTDSRNCTTTESFTVSTDAGTLQIQINTTDAICTASNGAATAVVTGGTAPYTYTWDNGNTGATLTGIAPGNYSVSVTDANGCSVTEGTTVNATTQNLQVQVQTQPTGCGTPSGSATVTVTGGTAPYTYHWSNGGNTATITGLDAGNYSVIVTDANGCTTTVPDIRIEGTGNLQVFFTTEDSYCTQSNGSIEATVSGGNAPYTYQWSNGQTTQQIENLSPGDYSVTITDNGGCVFNSHTITVQSIDYVPNVTAQITPVICTEKGSIRLEILNGEGPYSYQWTNGAITATAAQLEPGIYGVTVTDIRGCKAVLTDLEVTESTQTLPVTLGGPKNVCDGESVTLNPGIYETYQWSDGSTNSTLVVTEPGSYSVQVTDRNGCSGSASIDVTGNCGGHIYFPSAFTPDGDGLNDVFGAAGIVPGIKKYKLVIFNRWGQKVFESNRIEDKWDGTYKGKIYSTQTFTWYAEYRIDNNSVMTEKGTLLLIR